MIGFALVVFALAVLAVVQARAKRIAARQRKGGR